MKLVRFGPTGREKPGIVDAKGRIRDLSKVVPDIAGDALSPKGLARIRKAEIDTLPLARSGVRLGPCVAGTTNFIAIGLNYADHAAETGAPIPKEPIIFNKAVSCICGPNDDTMIPKESSKLDWEVELGIVIGARARYLTKKNAMDAVAGYCLANDVSERVFQIERSGGQWTKGKSSETFGPLGPWLVTKDEIPDPQKLDMWLTVNGESRQKGSTRTMIFGVEHLVWYCSQFFVMEPGDVIITGTPPGVGLGMKPPQFLKAGDVVRLGVGGLGEQQQKVVKFKM
jgi:2-keto-4-pentenoate hydratase/2-oxohepta-3-ene-1,7-dioic acid hydratase in catechol pathway